MTQVISVVQEKGGAGKTTLLSSLAALMVDDGARVAVIDTDDRRNLEAWAKKGNIDLDWMYEDNDERLIPVVKKLKSADPAYDVIFIDTAGFKSALAIYAITASNLVLIPSKADESNAKAARRTYTHVQSVAESTDKDISGYVVLMDVDSRTNITKAIAEAIDGAGVPRLRAMCFSRTGFKEMQSTGQGPQGAAKAAAQSVLSELQARNLIAYYAEGGAWAKKSA
ncbi:MAG: ParA family protein [Saprospiraceae bacterium]|nr:ParA family protein [Saprospiraceae bacterium]